MDYCAKGCLLDEIQKSKKPLKEDKVVYLIVIYQLAKEKIYFFIFIFIIKILNYFVQVLLAVDYLHAQNMSHGDINLKVNLYGSPQSA